MYRLPGYQNLARRQQHCAGSFAVFFFGSEPVRRLIDFREGNEIETVNNFGCNPALVNNYDPAYYSLTMLPAKRRLRRYHTKIILHLNMPNAQPGPMRGDKLRLRERLLLLHDLALLPTDDNLSPGNVPLALRNGIRLTTYSDQQQCKYSQKNISDLQI